MNVGPGDGGDGGRPAGRARPLAAYVIADVFAGPTCTDARTPIGEVDLQTRYLGDTNLGIGLSDLRARTAPPREFAPDSFVPAATIELFLDGPPGTLPETVGQRGAGVVPGGQYRDFRGLFFRLMRAMATRSPTLRMTLEWANDRQPDDRWCNVYVETADLEARDR